MLTVIRYLLVREEEFEILKLATGVRDFISIAVKSLTVFVLRASFVVTEHANTVLHGKNLIVDAPVVSVLISQVIKTLTKLCNQLILL